LRALRAEDGQILEPLAAPWWGNSGDVLVEPGETVRHVYFPCGSSLISYLVVFGDGRAVETALIGREGAAGGIVSEGRLPAYARAEVRFPGPFLRIEIKEARRSKDPLPDIAPSFCSLCRLFDGPDIPSSCM
jgi:hypothetical protein